jgi:hypothetical protein
VPVVDEVFLRTDIRGGMEFRWNGTHWLSEQTWSWVYSMFNISLSTIERNVLPPDLGVYLMNVYARCFVQTTNNGSNYWTLQITTAIEDNTTTSRASGTTAAVSANGWREIIDTDINLLLTLGTDLICNFVAAPTAGSPGNAYPVAILTYRLRAI